MSQLTVGEQASQIRYRLNRAVDPTTFHIYHEDELRKLLSELDELEIKIHHVNEFGKFFNDLRRKVKSSKQTGQQDIAKTLKEIVSKWQRFVKANPDQLNQNKENNTNGRGRKIKQVDPGSLPAARPIKEIEAEKEALRQEALRKEALIKEKEKLKLEKEKRKKEKLSKQNEEPERKKIKIEKEYPKIINKVQTQRPKSQTPPAQPPPSQIQAQQQQQSLQPQSTPSPHPTIVPTVTKVKIKLNHPKTVTTSSSPQNNNSNILQSSIVSPALQTVKNQQPQIRSPSPALSVASSCSSTGSKKSKKSKKDKKSKKSSKNKDKSSRNSTPNNFKASPSPLTIESSPQQQQQQQQRQQQQHQQQSVPISSKLQQPTDMFTLQFVKIITFFTQLLCFQHVFSCRLP